MNLSSSEFYLPEESFRWFGPEDPVPLAYIRQAGATGVFSALHQIPYGELWPREMIRERKQRVAAAGLRWTVVESVPVHGEEIKTGRGDLKRLLDNYIKTLRNLAAEELKTVVYNFMPVLDWIRTDMNYVLPDGSRSMFYDPVKFCAFEIHAMKRAGATEDYSPQQIEAADTWWRGLDESGRVAFVQTIIDVFPGVKLGLQLDDVRAMLARYAHLKDGDLENNLARFHEAVVPVAEELGDAALGDSSRMIRRFSVLGLPRIVSTTAQIAALLKRVDSPANGVCFCTGSLSARPSNDLAAMFKTFASRIHAVHLRSTQLLPDGSFYEAGSPRRIG